MKIEEMKNETPDTMISKFHYGLITYEELIEYAYIWRNSCFRYSDLWQEYEIPDRINVT